MSFHKQNPVSVVDPDLVERTLVKAWQQSIDKETGDHLVVIDGEPEAIRRIKPADVYPAP